MNTKTQNTWPFGPAPQRECKEGGEHEWKIIDLFHAAEPPAPSFQCAKCGYRWSRRWTRPEFERFLAQLDQGSRDHYAICLPGYPAEPEYASAAQAGD